MEIPRGWFFLNDLVYGIIWKNLPEIIGFGPGPAVGLGIGDICKTGKLKTCKEHVWEMQETDNTTSALMYILYIYIYFFSMRIIMVYRQKNEGEQTYELLVLSHAAIPHEPHDHYKPWFKMTMNKLVAGPCPFPLSINNGGSYIYMPYNAIYTHTYIYIYICLLIPFWISNHSCPIT